MRYYFAHATSIWIYSSVTKSIDTTNEPTIIPYTNPAHHTLDPVDAMRVNEIHQLEKAKEQKTMEKKTKRCTEGWWCLWNDMSMKPIPMQYADNSICSLSFHAIYMYYERFFLLSLWFWSWVFDVILLDFILCSRLEVFGMQVFFFHRSHTSPSDYNQTDLYQM